VDQAGYYAEETERAGKGALNGCKSSGIERENRHVTCNIVVSLQKPQDPAFAVAGHASYSRWDLMGGRVRSADLHNGDCCLWYSLAWPIEAGLTQPRPSLAPPRRRQRRHLGQNATVTSELWLVPTFRAVTNLPRPTTTHDRFYSPVWVRKLTACQVV
jgi:hypothetical protein